MTNIKFSDLAAQFGPRPDVPPPEDCDPGEHWRGAEEGLHSRIEVRMIKGRRGFEPLSQSRNESGDRIHLHWIRRLL